MILTTKTKVAAAGAAYRVMSLARSIVGKNRYVTLERGGLKWCLDLSEGIDFSIYLFGAFERSTVASLQKLAKPGDVIFDIGANIGAHTLGLARCAGPEGRVFAFEPTDFAFAKLKRNLALNPELELRTRSYQILLASDPGAALPAKIYSSWPLAGDEPVHPKHRGRLSTTSDALVDTVDGFVTREGIARLDLIKIDVDGNEYPVLKGAIRTLARFGPTLVMELSPYVHAEQNQSFAALIELLRDLGYSLQDASTWRSLPLRADDLERLIPDGAGINVIARPGEGYEGKRRA
jgi:FkbM family methyltransferase